MSAGANLLVIPGQQFRPQRLHHPGAAIVGRAAADTDNNLPDARVQRMANRVTSRRRYALQTACRRHFNKRALLIARKTKKSLYGLAERTGDGDRYPASLGRGNHGFNGSFATVGDRQFDVLRIGINFPKTLLYRGCNIQRTQALLV